MACLILWYGYEILVCLVLFYFFLSGTRLPKAQYHQTRNFIPEMSNYIFRYFNSVLSGCLHACTYTPINSTWWEQKPSCKCQCRPKLNDTQLLQFSIGLPTHIRTFLSSFLLSFIFGMHHNSPMALLLQESEGIHRTASTETQALLDV